MPSIRRRLDIRKWVETPIQVTQISSADGQSKDPRGKSFQCRDISIKGLFLETNMKLEANDILEMHLTLPGETKKLVLVGEIRRFVAQPTKATPNPRPYGAGIQFMNVPQEIQRYLVNYMAGTFLLY